MAFLIAVWYRYGNVIVTVSSFIWTWTLVKFKWKVEGTSGHELKSSYTNFLVTLTDDQLVLKFPMHGLEITHVSIALDLDGLLGVRGFNGKDTHNYKVDIPADFHGGKEKIENLYLGHLFVSVTKKDVYEKTTAASEAVPQVYASQSYWESRYAEELKDFEDHGLSGKVWFAVEVTEMVASWTKRLCLENPEVKKADLAAWAVLDVGTGNGLLLNEFAKQGFRDLTGIDFSDSAIALARSLAVRDGFTQIQYQVEDILTTNLDRKFTLVLDKGTLDVIGTHPDGPISRRRYWESISRLIAPCGIVVITSSYSTKEDLVKEVEDLNLQKGEASEKEPRFTYVDEITTFPSFMAGGTFRPLAVTVAFLRN